MSAYFIGITILLSCGVSVRSIARGTCVVVVGLLTYRALAGWQDRERKHRQRDELVDEASQESFPASDPPAWITAEFPA
jgi:hypothetical protein